MSRLDDRLTRELERIARPADPADAFQRVDHRRARRHIFRRVQAAGLAVVVLAGTTGGFVFLSNAFREPEDGIGDVPPVRNGLIVYSEVRNAGQRLWVVEPDGTGARRLTTGDGASDTGPSISPDGQLVAFTRTDEQGSAIYLVGIDGTGLRRVTEPSWGARDPAWSPDDVELVFAGDAGDGEGLYVMAPLLEGAAPHRITERGLSAESDPSWSPDGAWIAFSASTDPAGDAEPINFDLFVTRADASGELRHLTDSPEASDVMPAWSPDGELLAFITGSNALDDSPTGGIAVIRPDGSGLRILTDEHAFELNPTWAPDGSVIAFDRDDPAGTSIFTIRPDGSDLTRIALGSEPAWQPLLSGSLSPAPSSSSTTSNLDLGLGFPVCNVRTLGGGAEGDVAPDFDGNGSIDTAYVATRRGDTGGCPRGVGQFEILGVDLTGDGKIDAEYGPLSCQLDCTPFMAIDLDEDGDDELIVEQLGGAILGLVPYSVAGIEDVDVDGPSVNDMVVAPPGDEANGFTAGGPMTIYLGGDEGFAATIDCRQTEFGLVLVATTGALDSIEQPTTWTIRTTTFRLGDQGFEPIDSSRFKRPAVYELPMELHREDTLCGQPYPPNPSFPT